MLLYSGAGYRHRVTCCIRHAKSTRPVDPALTPRDPTPRCSGIGWQPRRDADLAPALHDVRVEASIQTPGNAPSRVSRARDVQST